MKKLFLAVLVSGSAAFAAGQKTDAFHGLDKDGSKDVSAEEAAAHADLSSNFATLDKDGNGKLDETEIKAFKPAAPAKKEKSAK